jgi:hypothetical protein
MKRRLSLFLSCFVMTAAACGGSGSDVPKCIPGISIACTGPGACAGNQVCMTNGTFAACTCGAGTAGNSGTGGTTGRSGSGGTVTTPGTAGVVGPAGSAGVGGGTGGDGIGGSAAGTAGRGGTVGATAGTTGTAGAATGTGGATITGAAGSGGGGAGTGGGTVCNPVAQTGCAAGQRCAWIWTGQNAGHNACLADGAATLGGACTVGPDGETTGFDNCKKGTSCVSGVCKTICSTTPDSCPVNYACDRYTSSPFDLDGTMNIGFCDSTCNPLTQTRDTDGAPACGSLNPSAPTLGCFGPLSGRFLCASILSTTKTHGIAAGVPTYINSCAPGYQPLRPDSNTSSAPICTALCRPANTSSAIPAGAPGQAGSGYTCPDKGAPSPHECRYFWWLFEDTANFKLSPYSNTLGYCLNYPSYRFDSNGDGSLDMVYPSCTTLSPTAHNYDLVLSDAEVWGCLAHP